MGNKEVEIEIKEEQLKVVSCIKTILEEGKGTERV